jgi:hypothetical protein
MLPGRYGWSAGVAAQLRSELASRGRDFTSISIPSSSEKDAARLRGRFEVAASRLGDTTTKDRILLAVEVDETRRRTTTGLVSGSGREYTLRIREGSPSRALVEAIVEALVRIGAIDRLTEKRGRREINPRFEGAIRTVTSGHRHHAQAEPLANSLLLTNVGQIQYDRRSARPLREPRRSRRYSSAQLD